MTISVIEVLEHASLGAGRSGRSADASRLFVVEPMLSGHRLLLAEALTRLDTLRAERRAFDTAIIRCDDRADCAATYARARVARALLPLIVDPGSLVFAALSASPRLASELEGLARALEGIGPKGVRIALDLPPRRSGVYPRRGLSALASRPPPAVDAARHRPTEPE
jgi:hypothetical protein